MNKQVNKYATTHKQRERDSESENEKSITYMKEYNAAALFNLCFSRRQMFEFVRTHGKICNNKTISAFVSTMFHCHFFSSTLSLFLFIVGNIIAFHLFSPSLSLSIAIYLSHPLWFYHKMCFTFCHFNILLPLVVLPFSFCLWQRENCDEASWWDIVKTNAKNLIQAANI